MLSVDYRYSCSYGNRRHFYLASDTRNIDKNITQTIQKCFFCRILLLYQENKQKRYDRKTDKACERKQTDKKESHTHRVKNESSELKNKRMLQKAYCGQCQKIR